jgi:hypothetical protein
MSTFKKLFASVAAVMVVASTVPANVFAASYSSEQEDAYDYAFGAGLTTQATIDGARLNDSITRAELAKVASTAAENAGLSLDTGASCSFTDLAPIAGSDLPGFVTKACQYGLMGVNTNGVFNPTGLVTRAELAAVIDRIINGDANVGGNPWYAGHMASLQDAGIMNDISNPSALALRFHAFVMFQRADEEGTTPAVCQDPMVQLSCALGLDDCPAECSGDEDEDEDEEPTYEIVDGTLNVDLSNDSPDSSDVPESAVAHAASFEFSADTDEDVSISNLTVRRTGLGTDSTLENVAAFVEGARVSRAKSFNSDDEAVLTFNPALEVKAGEELTVDLIVTVGAGVEGERFSLTIDEDAIGANAEVNGDFPLTSAQHEVASVPAAGVMIQDDGSIADVEVGDTQVAVAKFQVEQTTGDSDVYLTHLTLQDTENNIADAMDTFKLYADGDLVGEVDSTNNDYVSFVFDDEVTVEEGDSVDFVLKADIVANPDDEFQFVLDDVLDLMGYDEEYGFGLQVDNQYAASNLATITAGELSLVSIDATANEVRPDRTNVVLGELKFVVGAGTDLEIVDLELTFAEDGVGSPNVSAILENIELYDASKNATYGLTRVGGANTSEDWGDEDLYIPLGDTGIKTFQIRADTLDTATAGQAIEITMNANTQLIVQETSDDVVVNDVTPSSLSWNTVEIVESTLDVNELSLSDITKVVGAKDVVLAEFELETDDAGAVFVDSMTFTGTADFDNQFVSQVKLYHTSISDNNELESKNGNQISVANVITFDDFGDVEIEANAKKKFFVVIDIVDGVSADNGSIQISFTDLEGKDEDNNDIGAVTGFESDRNVSTDLTGSLAVVTDNTETSVLKEKRVLGNTTSEWVASYEFTATNEDFTVNEMTLTFAGSAPVAAINEVIVYANDQVTVLAAESVTSTAVLIDSWDEDLVISTEDSSNIYIKVSAERIGYTHPGAVSTDNYITSLVVDEAQGVDSNDYVTVTETDDTTEFDVYPVLINGVAKQPQTDTTTYINTLGGGESTLASFTMTAQSTTNTKTGSSTTLKTKVEQIALRVDVATNITGATTGTDFTLENVTTSNDGPITAVLDDVDSNGFDAGDYLIFDTSAWTNDNEVKVAPQLFVVKGIAGVVVTNTNGSLRLSMDAYTPSALYDSVVFGSDNGFSGGTYVVPSEVEFVTATYAGI